MRPSEHNHPEQGGPSGPGNKPGPEGGAEQISDPLRALVKLQARQVAREMQENQGSKLGCRALAYVMAAALAMLAVYMKLLQSSGPLTF